MDDDLRPTIDRLITEGGRLAVHGSGLQGPTLVTLDQPGSRFGILEVRARIELDPADPIVAALVDLGWTDPTVTQRLGREIRLRADDDPRPILLTRIWRVPPSLASEIVVDVRAAAGLVSALELVPLGARRRTTPSASTASPEAPPTAELDEIGDTGRHRDRPNAGRSQAARTVRAPLRWIGAAVAVLVVAVAWAGLVRGSQRPDAGPTPSPSVAVVISVTTSPALSDAPAPAGPPLPAHVIGASTEDVSGPATAALDGDPTTAWHAAFGVPQWIEIGLDRPSTVRQVVLLAAQETEGTSRHMIQVAAAGGVYQVVGIVDRLTADRETITFRPSTPLDNVDRIRIETMASPSNAGWYEVVVS